MNGSSTSRSQRCWTVVAVIAAAAALCVANSALALDPERALSQYIRDRWGSDQGFPGGPVHALTQSADGYLWIAAEKGLVRFDGLTFRLFEPSGLAAGAGPTALGIVADPDGSLWARLRGPALVRVRHGVLQSPASTSNGGPPDVVVTAMFRSTDDRILLALLGNGVVAYRGGTATTIVPQSVMPTASIIISIAETRDGDVWLGTRDAGLLRVQGPRVTRIAQGLPDQKINSLLRGDREDLWIGTDRGVARWDGVAVTTSGVPHALAEVPALAMIRDRDSNVWIAAASRGLMRVDSHGVATSQQRPSAAGEVTAVFEDREGNVWAGTTKGIERLRDGVFTTFSSTQGLPPDSAGPVYVDSAGRIWFAPARGGLYWLRDGQVGRIDQAGLSEEVVYSIAGEGDDVWVGRQRGGLTRLRANGAGFTAESFTQSKGLAQNSVYAVLRARDGAVWAGTLSAGVSRLADGALTTFTTADGLSSNTVAAMLESADGTIWFGTPNGVTTLAHGTWRSYASGDDLPSNDINVLFEDSAHGVWAGTAAGLALFRDGRWHRLANSPAALRGSVLGMAEDRAGSLWIATADRVVRVRRDELADPARSAVVREYGAADGLLTLEAGVKRHRSVLADSRGRIWFARSNGVSMADPVRAGGPGVPSLTHMESVSADGTFVDVRGAARIDPRPRRVTLAYAGLSLAVPERVRFRYRLDGFDRDWSAAVADREAVYTNLNPGSYTFRVTASDDEGQWNGAQAVVTFHVQPSLWQTIWFRMASVGLCAVAGVAAYRLRVLHVARQLNKRFDEKLAERTRIAQELHDTLLQGFVSASMQLYVATDRLPIDSPARPALTRVLDLMERVIEEGRNAVRGLRSPGSAPHDLEQAFGGIREEVAGAEQTDYRVVIEGQVRPLHPLIRDEVYRIGREALVNAFRHSGAVSVELELDYASNQLRVLVRDDGCGMAAAVARAGKDGHWGIAGMRERAGAIGAGLTISSRSGAGTEIELTVPGKIAFDRGAGRNGGPNDER